MVDDDAHVFGEHRVLEQHFGVVDGEVFNRRDGNAVHDRDVVRDKIGSLERRIMECPTLLREYTASKRERRTSHSVSSR